jgi:hypothetical protein
MAVSYTPGVGHVVKHLLEHPEELGEQVAKDNVIALVADGTAMPGYGTVGPYAGMPVTEGKATMFKMLAGIDCMPLCLNTNGPRQLIDVMRVLLTELVKLAIREQRRLSPNRGLLSPGHKGLSPNDSPPMAPLCDPWESVRTGGATPLR